MFNCGTLIRNALVRPTLHAYSKPINSQQMFRNFSCHIQTVQYDVGNVLGVHFTSLLQLPNTDVKSILYQKSTKNKIIQSINQDLKSISALKREKMGEDVLHLEDFSCMNRNKRKPSKANHGKRPCSRVARRAKRRAFGNPRRKG